MNGFPWLALGTVGAIALFVIWMVWRLPHAIDRAERRNARRNHPERERTRLRKSEERRFWRIAKKFPDVKKDPRNLTGGSHGHLG